jgi:hypothetical protein
MHPRIIEQLNALRLQELRSPVRSRAGARHGQLSRDIPFPVIGLPQPEWAGAPTSAYQRPPLDLSAREAEVAPTTAEV